MKAALKAEWERLFERLVGIQRRMDALKVRSETLVAAAPPVAPSSSSTLPFEQTEASIINSYVEKIEELSKADGTEKVSELR